MFWIRQAQASDAHSLADLHAASWRTAYRGALSDEFLAGDIVNDRKNLWAARLSAPAKNQHTVISGVGNDALGFACVYGGADERWGSFLNNIHVRESHQRSGMGRKLLNSCASVCAERDASSGLYLWVVQSNHKAQSFYARYGAENVGESTWNAPGGTVVPLYRFAWRDVNRLHLETAA